MDRIAATESVQRARQDEDKTEITAMTENISNTRKSSDAIFTAVPVSSSNPIPSMSAEFFSTEMSVFVIDGRDIRRPIGSTTRRNASVREKPSARAASSYRRSTAPNPARRFSTLKAPPHRTNASHPTVKALRVGPTRGSAKYRKKTCTNKGVLRNSSTYT